MSKETPITHKYCDKHGTSSDCLFCIYEERGLLKEDNNYIKDKNMNYILTEQQVELLLHILNKEIKDNQDSGDEAYNKLWRDIKTILEAKQAING